MAESRSYTETAIVSSLQLNIWQCIHTTSEFTEVLQYYQKFPECWEIMCMHNVQWIPAPCLHFSNRPGNEAITLAKLNSASYTS